MTMHPEQLVKLLVHEAFASRRLVVGLFVCITVAMLGAGLVWPRGYVASTTILVGERNIIQPLMQGAAVTTDVQDRSRLAREIISGRKIMNQIMADAGWVQTDMSASDQENMINKLIKQTTVANVGRNLIKIEYRDDEAERAFFTTKRYAEIFIAESLTVKAAESQAAFDFIDKQVQEYHQKLLKSEEELKVFRSANLDAQPGADADIGARLNALQLRIEQATQELKETEIKKQSLEKQLSGEAEVASVISREGQYRTRISELQSQIDTLRLSYHETYPDIVRLRHQIEDLNEAIAVERQRREAARASGRVAIDDAVINNPMYQQLKRELSTTQIQLDTLSARIAEARRQLHQELERGKRVHGGEATLAELTRDYQVNRDIYQDLLKRRENARVSMNIDRDNQGLTFKIQEPATLPLQPSGFRFWHFVLLGIVLGAVAPIGLLYAKIQIDPRIRLPAVIVDRHSVPVLATVPHLWSSTEINNARRDVERLAVTVAATILFLGIVVIARLAKVI
jgi:polysaccharide chain length determinant protein (PEP-CTERM system associated)